MAVCFMNSYIESRNAYGVTIKRAQVVRKFDSQQNPIS